MTRRIDIGLLYSRSGSYALISEACRTGALAAIAEVNEDPRDLVLVPVERDPGGNIDLYAPLCEDLLAQQGLRHVIGCVTSWSRKEVIPTLEKAGGTLWYAVPYEGFEASDHVVYTHACPNQHLLPLLDWALPAFGRRGYLTGSNYIWGWEMNRLARERIVAAGGAVLGERYLPIGSAEVGRMIEEIRATAPDFILNSLIGPSSYTFLAAYRALGEQDARFRPDRCPVMSCNLTECELPAIGAAAEGLIAAGPYFRGEGRFGSSHEAAAHAAVMELARLLTGRPGAERLALPALLEGAAPGIVDPQTHHTALPVLIAQVEAGRFAVRERLAPRPGDPYLTHPAPPRPASLRVVS
ncbi:transporter substrate-binding protein [Cereibacter sphaeroides]|uniref:transporter substrate-binding protein n=1 Tax=Cereibacter sphaeroides TaxID=1063 RepID=UPI001F3D6E81|nr:transporter substrate-binding protein [Cereibacter sphaeroides]MCE6959840.1 transporter substrate-binding protein [Cereibacter sphaeroides]MCE6974694.1 transporter substrate-binding protein [Cereibacter sphaeroides]